MQDAIVLFALAPDLMAVEFNMTQDDYSCGGVSITREQAEAVLGAEIGALSATSEDFSIKLAERLRKVVYEPDVMKDIYYENVMGLDE